jgi:hypothetical protein
MERLSFGVCILMNNVHHRHDAFFDMYFPRIGND